MPEFKHFKASVVSAFLIAWCSPGCGTAMSATRIMPAVRVHEHGLGVHIAEVHVSDNVRHRDFSESSRVLVVLDLIADSDARLDLSEARLSLTGIDESESTHRALATGVGQPPRMLEDGVFAPSLELVGGQHLRAWVAFGEFAPRAQRELPERIELALPGGQRLELSRPGHTPVWHGTPPSVSSGTAVWIQGSADETSINLTAADNRYVAGPLVIGYRYGAGLRAPIYRMDTHGDGLVCCNVALAADVAWPIWRNDVLMLAPFIGVEAALLTRNPDVTRRNWVGPSLGIELADAMRPPRHGPFPIDYPPSLLGTAYLRVALVHWFGPDRSLPSFGYMLSAGVAYGN
jgi:hypothetical protein